MTGCASNGNYNERKEDMSMCIYHGNLALADAAYLAGLIDGEGSIAVSRTKTSSSAKACKRGFAYRASVTITMTDLAVLEWAKRTAGVGNICVKKARSPNHKQAWSWTVWSIEAATLLAQILPFLKVKAEQAENLIEFQGAMRQPGSKGLTDDEWSLREAHYAKSQHLNQRGIAA